MKNIRRLSVLLFASIPGLFLCNCSSEGSNKPDEPVLSANCDLLTFSIEGDRNGLANTIVFEIDEQKLIVTGNYLSQHDEKMPDTMVPTFTFNGKKASVNGVKVQSELAKISFLAGFRLVVEAENGDTKTYTVILNVNKQLDDKCELLSFRLEANRNGLESTVMFEIDEEALKVAGTYKPQITESRIRALAPSFTINGESVSAGGETIESGVSELSFAEEFRIEVKAANGDTKTYTVKLECPNLAPDPEKSDKCDLLSLVIAAAQNNLNNTINFTLAKDGAAFTGIYLKWIKNNEPDMLVPTFTTTGQRVLVNGEPVVSGETKVSFAENVNFVVEAENGHTKTYTVSLNCPQINTELPVLRFATITSASQIGKNTYVNTKLDMYSPHTTSGWWDQSGENVQIRGRGNSTWDAEKKPYRVKFPSKYSPIGLNHAKEKDWVILAQDMDKSLLRNHMAFEMSRVMFNNADGYHDPDAILWTPCSQFVNIYFGDNYHGLYQMSDHKEIGAGRMNIEQLTAADTGSSVITGGYLLESDVHGDTPRFSSATAKIPFHMYYPKSDDYSTSQLTYISNHIKDAESVLFGSGFADPVNGWRKYFDEKTMIDFMIIKEFTGDYDGFTSTQIYKKRGNDKIFFGPVWDVDKGWDNDKRKDAYSGNGKLIIYEGFYYAEWFKRLWENDPNFKKAVQNRWNARKQELYNIVMRELEQRPAQMAKAIEANFSVWTFYKQTIGDAPLPAANYQLEIERIRELTNKRITQLDNLLK